MPSVEEVALRVLPSVEEVAPRVLPSVEEVALRVPPSVEEVALRPPPSLEEVALRVLPSVEEVALRPSRDHGSDLEQPRLIRQHDRLRSITQVQLLQQPGHMRLHRRVADEQLAPDLGVRVPLGDQ